jgi:hypothetical protein
MTNNASQRNDLLVAAIPRTGELRAWFVAEHLVDTPLVRSSEAAVPC